MLFACNNSEDYKSDKDSTAKQSAVAAQTNADTSAMSNDGSAANKGATSTKTSKSRPNLAKKGHKGTARRAAYTPDYTVRMASDKNGVYNYAEVKPMFPGGEKQLDKFIEDNIQYPQDAIDNGVEGTVTVTFAVDEKGNVYSPQIKDEKLGYGLDDEALNVIKKMPKWTPGSIKGKNVKSYYDLPITFALAD
jgi:TonB family protein